MWTIPKTKSRKFAASAQQEIDLQRFGEVNTLVVNPTTELAVLLKFDPKTMEVPIVVEKGNRLGIEEVQGLTEQGFQIVESELLAAALYNNCDVGQEIPVDLYPDVSEMLVGVYLLNEIAARLKTELVKELKSQSSYARTRTRSAIRVSLD